MISSPFSYIYESIWPTRKTDIAHRISPCCWCNKHMVTALATVRSKFCCCCRPTYKQTLGIPKQAPRIYKGLVQPCELVGRGYRSASSVRCPLQSDGGWAWSFALFWKLAQPSWSLHDSRSRLAPPPRCTDWTGREVFLNINTAQRNVFPQILHFLGDVLLQCTLVWWCCFKDAENRATLLLFIQHQQSQSIGPVEQFPISLSGYPDQYSAVIISTNFCGASHFFFSPLHPECYKQQ